MYFYYHVYLCENIKTPVGYMHSLGDGNKTNTVLNTTMAKKTILSKMPLQQTAI